MAYDFCTIQTVEGRLCAIDSGNAPLNHGGLVEVHFFRESDIVSVPSFSFAFSATQRAEMVGSLVLKAGSTGYRFRYTPDTGRFTENQQESDDGIAYEQVLNISIPKDRPEITWLKQRMEFGRYSILYRDGNTNVKLLRNQRVKFDLNTGNTPTEYNGHILTARRLADQPAPHWDIADGASIESLYTAASLLYNTQLFTLPEGWQAGRQLQLENVPATTDALLLIYNNALMLRFGEHYTLSGSLATLLFADMVDAGGPGTIIALNATNAIGTAIAGYARHTATKTAAYTSGETITLPSAPVNADSLMVQYNEAITLRPGTDYTLAGSTTTLLFAGDPDGGTDRFHAWYVVPGTPITILGWKQYTDTIYTPQSAGYTFAIPHTPIANSLLLWMDNNLLLLPGIHYNNSTNEIEILFPLPAGSRLDAWYAY